MQGDVDSCLCTDGHRRPQVPRSVPELEKTNRDMCQTDKGLLCLAVCGAVCFPDKELVKSKLEERMDVEVDGSAPGKRKQGSLQESSVWAALLSPQMSAAATATQASAPAHP